MNFEQLINKVFDTYLGQTIPLPAVVGLGLKDHPEVTRENYPQMKKGMMSAAHTMQGRGELIILSGKDGGVSRSSDLSTLRREKLQKKAYKSKRLKEIKKLLVQLTAERDELQKS